MTSSAYLNYNGVPVQLSALPGTYLYSAVLGTNVVGGSGADGLYDTAGGAILSGGAGDDTYVVGDARTQVIEAPNAGIDTINTYTDYVLPQNVEILNAISDNVSIVSNAQGGTLIATNHAIKLVSGTGSDVMVDAGSGADTFEFSSTSGHDVVYGFQTSGANQDFIQLKDFGFTSFAQVQSHLTQSGADTVLTLSPTASVVLRNTQASSLTSSDFLLQLDTSHLQMSFDDEFNSLSLYNPATGQGTWLTSQVWGDANGAYSINARTQYWANEQEAYVDPLATGLGSTALGLNPFTVSNGVLTITASQMPAADKATLYGMDYISGLLTTEKSFSQTYGYFEIKAELTNQQGAFPAFWLLPQDNVGPTELDVFEHVDGLNNVTQGYGSGAGGTPHGQHWYSYVPDLSSGFHTYGMLWTASTITWYIDGVATAQIATPADMDRPMYMVTNLAVGGNWAGPATFTTAGYQVDYIHAFTLAESPVSAPAASSTSTTTTTTTTTPPPVVSDELDSAATATLGATQHILTLTGSAAVDGTGNDLGDTITGNAAMNHLTGGAGNDILKDGGGGGDIMTGGAGDDSYYVNDAHDTVVELPGGGHDTIYASVSYTLPANVEDLVLTGTANLTATGNSLVNHLTGNDGNNILISGGAGDIMAGGKGDDTYYVYSANDVVIENPGEGNDTIYSTVSYTAPANVETLILTGTANLNATANDQGMTLVGNAGTDTLTGGAGNDILTSGKGVDTLIGGAGDDTYYVNNAADVVVEGPNGGNDTVITGSSYTLPDNVENLVLLYAGSASGTGNALDNHITGNDGANKLFGMAGNDVINGGAGNDVINGGTGDDILTGGAGNDTFQFSLGAGHDTVTDFGANGDHDVIDISAYLAKNNHPTITDAASGLTLAFASGDTIHLLGVHPNQLIQTTTGFTI